MSFNQPRGDSSQYRRANRSGSFSQKNSNNFSGKGGGGAAAPPASANLQPNRSFSKKSSNAQGGQYRASGYVGQSDLNSVSANPNAPNGSQFQPAPAPNVQVPNPVVKTTTEQPAQTSDLVVPNAPSQVANVKPGPVPQATPTKDASKSFPIQFGCVSPGTLNGMQAHRDVKRQVPPVPIPSVPKQQIPRKDGGAGDQPKAGEGHQTPKASRDRDIQVPSPVPASQTQKAHSYNIPGVSLPMPFHHHVPAQFGGPNPQMQPQGMAGTSFTMPMHLPMGSAPQLPHSIYLPGLHPHPHSHPHPHPMQAQGIMHHGQGLNFPSQIGQQMPPQIGNLGMGHGPQFPQLQQPSNFVGSHKPVKITHPDTHEELRLENTAPPRSHQNMPQSRPVTSVQSYHPMNYFPNPAFVPGPVTSVQSSHPMNYFPNPAFVPGQGPPRVSFPASQGSQTASFVNPSYKPPSLDSSHDVQKAVPSVAPASVQVATKPTTEVHGEKINDPASSTPSGANNFIERKGILQKAKKGKKGKKKRKEILQKADAARTTSDLYMAYKGPEEKKEIIAASENKNIKEVSVDSTKDGVYSSEDRDQGKTEPDDWEDATEISTPKLETTESGSKVSGSHKHVDSDEMAKKYTRDFLMKFSEQCTDLPEGFEITSYVADALMVPNVNVSRESYPSPGRVMDRSRRGGVAGDEDRWNRIPGPLVPGRDIRMDGHGGNNFIERKEILQKAKKRKKGKKKRKEILQKADVTGSTSDLYMAYKGPEEKKEIIAASENKNIKEVSVDSTKDDVYSSEDRDQGKTEPDDWEDATEISTPKLETTESVSKVSGSHKHVDRWDRIPGSLVPGRDIRMDGHGGNFRPGQGKNHGVLRNVRGQPSSQYAGGILSGPMQPMSSHVGVQRGNSDADRWQRATGFQKGLLPSPQTPAPVMHKAERKYQVGKIADDEEAKQRQLKAIQNKLRPQNFERLFEQVKEVNIDNAGILTGVISQIFDKALMEPTFCEMYANFCFHLARVLPDSNEDNEKITFMRLLLDKCQEEFERGEREEEEAGSDDTESKFKQSPAEREEKRIQTHRRMLGNIRLMDKMHIDSCVEEEYFSGKEDLKFQSDYEESEENQKLKQKKKCKRYIPRHLRGPVANGERRALWEDLNSLKVFAVPWILAGDFNTIRSSNEKMGGKNRVFRDIMEFDEFIDGAGLDDMNNTGSTWYRKAKDVQLEILDRTLINSYWLQHCMN